MSLSKRSVAVSAASFVLGYGAGYTLTPPPPDPVCPVPDCIGRFGTCASGCSGIAAVRTLVDLGFTAKDFTIQLTTGSATLPGEFLVVDTTSGLAKYTATAPAATDATARWRVSTDGDISFQVRLLNQGIPLQVTTDLSVIRVARDLPISDVSAKFDPIIYNVSSDQKSVEIAFYTFNSFYIGTSGVPRTPLVAAGPQHFTLTLL